MARKELTEEQRERLGKLIRGLRMSRGLSTQVALSEHSDVSDLTIRRLEDAQTPNPRGDVLHKLEVALELPPATLIGYATGQLSVADLQRVTDIRPAVRPAWMRRDPDIVTTEMLKAMEMASPEARRKAIEAAMKCLERESD